MSVDCPSLVVRITLEGETEIKVTGASSDADLARLAGWLFDSSTPRLEVVRSLVRLRESERARLVDDDGEVRA